MIIGGGHIFDMIARMKANRALLRKNDFFEKKSKLFLRKREHEHPAYHIATPEQLLTIRQEIKLENRSNFIRSTLIITFLASLIGIAMWFLF
jgi:hypothetical protein